MGRVPSELVARLCDETGLALDSSSARSVGGGSINRCYRVDGRDGAVFVKVNAAAKRAMFEAEAAGLEALGATRTIGVPRVLAVGAVASSAFLALEWLDLGGGSGSAQARLGERLAAMHRHGGDAFGWHRDNTIGATPQPNPRMADWLTFWREARLGHQLELAVTRGLPETLAVRLRRLLASLDRWLGGHRPASSIVHGDLWGGNWAVTVAGEPCIFDPAVYWGDREVDVAMTRLFGGFSARFYAAYESAWPLPDGAEARAELYNLYHLLNHFNLFGAGYAGAIDTSLARLERRA